MDHSPQGGEPTMKWLRTPLAVGLAALVVATACGQQAPAQPAGATQAPAAAGATQAPAQAAAPTAAAQPTAAAAAPASAPGGVTYAASTPEPGTDIPQVTVKWGMRPYADNTFYVIGLEKGWYKDVGIAVDPAPYGIKTTEDQWVNILLSRQVDMNTATCATRLPTYKTTNQLKC